MSKVIWDWKLERMDDTDFAFVDTMIGRYTVEVWDIDHITWNHTTIADCSNAEWNAEALTELCLPHYQKQIAAIATANGYVKLEPGQVVSESPFDEDDADYLLDAIEKMKCDDCSDQCGTKTRGLCLYLTIRAKLRAALEVGK